MTSSKTADKAINQYCTVIIIWNSAFALKEFINLGKKKPTTLHEYAITSWEIKDKSHELLSEYTHFAQWQNVTNGCGWFNRDSWQAITSQGLLFTPSDKWHLKEGENRTVCRHLEQIKSTIDSHYDARAILRQLQTMRQNQLRSKLRYG